MPQRPRAHQLESESRRAFHAASPAAWVSRDLTDDYGIDAEVELFDARGYATGEKSLVQLKATDEEDLAKALRIPISFETAEYYDSLRLPVLMVRYLAATRTLYACWFHAFDPEAVHPEQKSATLRFAADDKWTPETPAHLAVDVAAWRQFRAPTLSGNVTIAVDMADGIHGLRRYELVSQLRQAASAFKDFRFEPLRPEVYSPNVLRIDDERIEVRLASKRRFDYPIHESSPATLLCDCLAGIALALGAFGHAVEGSWLLARFAGASSVIIHPPLAASIASVLARANHQSTLIALASAVLDRGLASVSAFFVTMLFSLHRKLSREERLVGIDVLPRLAAKLETGDQDIAAQMHYNAGSLMREAGMMRRALHSYRRAAEVNPAYRKRGYWWAEMAGMLFMREHYAMSAKLYRCALDQEDDTTVACQLADALLFIGRYAEAEAIWNARVDVITEDTALWYLKLRAVRTMLRVTKIPSQKRARLAALVQFAETTLTDEQILRRCERALALDAACGLAWFNFAGVCSRGGNMQGAAEAYLVAAMTGQYDVQTWGNVIAAALNAGDELLAQVTEVAGFTHRRQSLVRDLASRVPSEYAEEYANTLDGVVEDLPPPSENFVVRDHARDGTWTEIRKKKEE